MFLERALELTRRRIRDMAEVFPAAHLAELCSSLPPTPSLSEALRQAAEKEVGVIAEIKRRSPSRGDIRPDLRVAETVRAYRRGGACAVSVLTEPHFFGGSLMDLAEASSAVDLPVLRKDFILDHYQLLEARAAGAAAVLLIASALQREELERLLAGAGELGLECLVEVHNERELEKALLAGAETIGINNRDLSTLQVDTGTALRLAPLVPPSVTLVAESGYRRREDLEGLREMGVHAVLVGEALSSSDDPESALQALRGGVEAAGREACGREGHSPRHVPEGPRERDI
ncbi:indole-3-glycerol phosphate synthase TrpC [Candidatus Solincola tengchongensis]|uniref:indole-3-glycerol phosphate synthase TrpC n=1 Tax=Candidatus Solincola tengchongensis TaxID=2900693 RepID=UPI00257DD251